MSTDKVSTLGQFIDRVSELRDAWRIDDKKELWFRGERLERPTSLMPTLFRPKKDPSKRVPFLPLKPIPDLLDIEFDLYEEFQRKAVQLSDQALGDDDWDWDSYFLMQHHEAPTRLLDWSDGSLMALHFALKNKEEGEAEDAIVYVLEPYRLMDQVASLPDRTSLIATWEKFVEASPGKKLDKEDWDQAYLPSQDNVDIPAVPLLLDFPHISRRVAAQRSRFMVFGTSPTWLADEAKRSDSAVLRITIDASNVMKIRRDLRECGVTESVIFPDLDGLGRELKQLWEERK